MEEDLGTRINQKRTKEVKEAGAKTVCTACPFCYTMLSDGIKELELEEELQAVDIAVLVAKAAGLDAKPQAEAAAEPPAEPTEAPAAEPETTEENPA